VGTFDIQFTPLQQQIFALLCKRAGTAMNQSEIAKELHVTPTGVAKALPALEKAKLLVLEKSKTMNLSAVSLSRDQRTLRFKQLENLRQLYASGATDLLEEQFPGTTIILFGSFFRGEDTVKSDIDIAVIGAKEKQMDLVRFERMLERQIIVQFYPSLRNVHKELRENLCDGLVLAGSVTL
jgi:predicted nucleotidyltransferase